jgi:cytochrome P450
MGLLTRCAREYGDFVPLRFGPMRMILLSNPEYLEYVLVAHPRDFIKSLSFRAMRPFGGNGIFLSEGDFWLRQRRLVQPAFHRERIAAYGDVMAGYAEEMVATWQSGETHGIQPEIGGLAMRIVAKTLLDVDVRGEAAELRVTLAAAFAALNARVSSIWLLLPESLPIPSNRRMRAAIQRLDEIVYRMIAERRASGGDRGDMLSILLRAQDEDDGTIMSDLQVRDEAMTLFVAGHETTATTLTWAWYFLSQYPEIDAELAAEVQAVLGGRTPTAADVPNLRFTKMVIDETLRLYPAVPALGREPVKDCEIGGYPIAKGTQLMMGMWTLHRDARFFDEPDEFRPHRWADGLAERLPRFAYLPFGGGPRQCIGSSFALMEAILVLATIAQRFRLTLAPGEVVETWVAPTVRPKGDLRMVVEHR